MFDMYDLSDLQNKVTYRNWRTGMVFNDTENDKLSHIILSILFQIAQWVTIEMPSNSPLTFPIAVGEWATAKRTPCSICTPDRSSVVRNRSF